MSLLWKQIDSLREFFIATEARKHRIENVFFFVQTFPHQRTCLLQIIIATKTQRLNYLREFILPQKHRIEIVFFCVSVCPCVFVCVHLCQKLFFNTFLFSDLLSLSYVTAPSISCIWDPLFILIFFVSCWLFILQWFFIF